MESCGANDEKVNRCELLTGSSGELTPERPRSERR